MKKPTQIEAQIIDISETQSITRIGKPDIVKKTITLETRDGQVVFVEIRNKWITLLYDNDINIGDLVVVSIIFQGSIKNDKRYNNLFVDNIVKS